MISVWGQCNACPPSLLVKRLPETLGQALVGLEVTPMGASPQHRCLSPY